MTREETIATLKANYPDACFEQLRDAVDTAISVLKQPEIVRCKDCRYTDEDGVCQSSKGLAIQDDDDYCSHAERRTDAETEV